MPNATNEASAAAPTPAAAAIAGMFKDSLFDTLCCVAPKAFADLAWLVFGVADDDDVVGVFVVIDVDVVTDILVGDNVDKEVVVVADSSVVVVVAPGTIVVVVVVGIVVNDELVGTGVDVVVMGTGVAVDNVDVEGIVVVVVVAIVVVVVETVVVVCEITTLTV